MEKEPKTNKSFLSKIKYLKKQLGANFYFDDFRYVAYVRDMNSPSKKLSETPFQFDFRNGDFKQTWDRLQQTVADMATEHGFDVY